jgi:hypothetical protein
MLVLVTHGVGKRFSLSLRVPLAFSLSASSPALLSPPSLCRTCIIAVAAATIHATSISTPAPIHPPCATARGSANIPTPTAAITRLATELTESGTLGMMMPV